MVTLEVLDVAEKTAFEDESLMRVLSLLGEYLVDVSTDIF